MNADKPPPKTPPPPQPVVAAGPAHPALMAAGVHAAAFLPDEAWNTAIFAGHLSLPGAFGFVHEAGGIVLARAAADEAEILTIAVAPEARRGVARALLRAAVARPRLPAMPRPCSWRSPPANSIARALSDGEELARWELGADTMRMVLTLVLAKKLRRKAEAWLRRPGALPLDPDGVPPPVVSAARRESLYHSRRAVNSTRCSRPMPVSEQIKLGSGAYGPSGVQGRALAFYVRPRRKRSTVVLPSSVMRCESTVCPCCVAVAGTLRAGSAPRSSTSSTWPGADRPARGGCARRSSGRSAP